MNWTEEEETICCKAVVKEYVYSKSSKDIELFLREIRKNAVFSERKRDSGSIKMRLQNIKAVLGEFGVENTLPLSELLNASSQTRQTLAQELQNAGIKYPKEKSK